MSQTQSVRRALGDRNILAAQVGYACFSIVEYATWLALLLYAFDRGGVGEAGVVAFVLLIPAAITAPFAAVFADRLEPSVALAAGFALQAVTCLVTAAAMFTDAPAVIVYVTAGVFIAVLSASRPTVSAVLPAISKAPEELAAANSMTGVVETGSAFVGPALTGLILISGSPSSVFAVSAALLALAAGLAITIRAGVVAHQEEEEEEEGESAVEEILGGLRLLRAERSPRLLVVMLAGTWMVAGALDVAFVALAVDQLDRSEAAAGLLASAVGVGGIIGSFLSFTLVGRRRLSLPTAFALLALALPILAIAATESLLLILLLLAISGLGGAIVDIAGRTLLQGLAAEDTLARVFGVLEGLGTAALALGSVGFSAIVLIAGLPAALLVTGAILPVLLVAQFGRLLAIDRKRPLVDPLALNLLRSMPIFTPLPAFQVEQLLVNMQAAEIEPGRVVFNQGDNTDQLYLVAAGSAVVELHNRRVVHERGGFFGEIALLRNQPRMATVRAGDDGLVVYSFEGQVFLQAISNYPRSQARIVREANRRLNEG